MGAFEVISGTLVTTHNLNNGICLPQQELDGVRIDSRPSLGGDLWRVKVEIGLAGRQFRIFVAEGGWG